MTVHACRSTINNGTINMSNVLTARQLTVRPAVWDPGQPNARLLCVTAQLDEQVSGFFFTLNTGDIKNWILVAWCSDRVLLTDLIKTQLGYVL